MRPQQPLDLNMDPETLQKVLREGEARKREEEAKKQQAIEAAVPKIKAWLEPKRSDIQSRADSTRLGLLTKPENMVTMPKLVDLVRLNVPDAVALDDAKLKDVIRGWAGFQIPDVALLGGQVPLDQIAATLDNMLGTPGKVKVQRRGDDFIEVNLEATQITGGPIQVSAFHEGGVGLQVQPRENVAGSFQIKADGSWKAQLIFGKNATPPVVNQMYNVWGAARGAMREIAQSKDDSLISTLANPVKDAVDTLNSISSKEEPKLGVSVTASGGGPTGGWAVEASVTYRF
jgi:hypothetical protein